MGTTGYTSSLEGEACRSYSLRHHHAEEADVVKVDSINEYSFFSQGCHLGWSTYWQIQQVHEGID